MTNPRTVEFERKIRKMLIRARDQAIREAMENRKSPYDMEIEKDSFIEYNQTYNNDATPEPTKRVFNNLVNREVFIEGISERMQTFRLNPKRAEQDIVIDKSENIWVRMPKNQKEGEQA